MKLQLHILGSQIISDSSLDVMNRATSLTPSALISTVCYITLLLGMILVTSCDKSTTIENSVSYPVISPAGGSYSQPVQVSIACEDEAAKIYYTTDSTTPDESANLYSEPFTINATATVKAIAFKDGFKPSKMAETNYTITTPSVAKPIISPSGGTFSSPRQISITCATPGATIRYTTTGVTPTTTSQLYSSAFTINTNTTIKAIAFKSGYLNSEVASQSYQIIDTDTYSPAETWSVNKVLTQRGTAQYAGVYKYENLTIGNNVVVTSKGVSQIVIKVRGTLTLGKNVVFAVRNGYYPNSPTMQISSITSANYLTQGSVQNKYNLYPGAYGKGGNGGDGGDGDNGRAQTFYMYGDWIVIEGSGGSGGGGGGGGYGGGLGGDGGRGGYGPDGSGYDGEDGSDNGGRGGYGGACTDNPEGGMSQNIGQNASSYDEGFGSGSSGGGGNGGRGAIGDTNYLGGTYINIVNGHGGGGGGGGGYGGGVLVIIATNIVYNTSFPPKFIVSGQSGGTRGGGGGAESGENGQGGLLIIESPGFSATTSMYNLSTEVNLGVDYAATNGGHGYVIGNPKRVIINGIAVQ